MEDYYYDMADEERYQASADHDRWDGYGDKMVEVPVYGVDFTDEDLHFQGWENFIQFWVSLSLYCDEIPF